MTLIYIMIYSSYHDLSDGRQIFTHPKLSTILSCWKYPISLVLLPLSFFTQWNRNTNIVTLILIFILALNLTWHRTDLWGTTESEKGGRKGQRRRGGEIKLEKRQRQEREGHMGRRKKKVSHCVFTVLHLERKTPWLKVMGGQRWRH